jgi:hypothetical protein
MFHSKKIAVLVAGAVAALALGSFAFAAIPDGGGVIHACYSTSTGAVRVTDTATNLPKGCNSKETALDWNQQGLKGDRGPSNAYATDGSATLTPNTLTIVATRTVPPGVYAVSGKVVLKASGANVPLTTVGCSLGAVTNFGSSADHAYGTVWSDGSGNVIETTLPLENDNTGPWLSNGGSVTLSCESPHTVDAFDATITAIQVATLDNQ